LAEETGRSGENHRPVASHWQTVPFISKLISHYSDIICS
jgi:hypothetical protein